MIRRLAAILAALAFTVAACNSSSAPALTDPVAVLQQSIAATQNLHSFHAHATLSGTIQADLTGTGSTAPLDLSGTTADIDADLVNKAVHISASIPALLGATADIIVIGDDTWTKVSLLGPKYQHSTASSMLDSFAPGTSGAASSAAPVDPKQIGDQLKTALGKLSTPPKLGADVQCGDTTCYDVTITLTSADIDALGGSLGGGLGGGLGGSAAPGASAAPSAAASGSAAPMSATIEIQVRKNDLYPAKIVATVDAGAQGKLTGTIEFSAFNQPVTITAPPADQVQS
jgi:hypothetical protein